MGFNPNPELWGSGGRGGLELSNPTTSLQLITTNCGTFFLHAPFRQKLASWPTSILSLASQRVRTCCSSSSSVERSKLVASGSEVIASVHLMYAKSSGEQQSEKAMAKCHDASGGSQGFCVGPCNQKCSSAVLKHTENLIKRILSGTCGRGSLRPESKAVSRHMPGHLVIQRLPEMKAVTFEKPNQRDLTQESNWQALMGLSICNIKRCCYTMIVQEQPKRITTSSNHESSLIVTSVHCERCQCGQPLPQV